MRKIQHLLLSAAMLLVSLGAHAQAKMTIELKNGTELSFYVSEINKISWTDGTNTPEGGDNDPGEQTVTGDATDITYDTANVTCYANNILENLATDLKVGLIYTSNGTPSKSNGTMVSVNTASIDADGKYKIALTNLNANTTYNYCSFVYQSGIYFYGKVKSFTTQSHDGDVLFVTNDPTNVTCYSAKVAAQMTIKSDITYTRLSYGICYGTTTEPTTQQQVSSQDASGAYTTILRGLTGGTVYYYRPYADIDGSIFYGPLSSFRTSDDNVVVTGDADAQGNVKSKLTIGNGAYSRLELGVCWSTTNEVPTVSDNTKTTNEVDEDDCYVVNINPYIGTYYYRSYVKVDGVAHYGEVKTLVVIAPPTNYTVGEPVDLGLSVKWADMNVGADSPEGYGHYYAWGETEPKAEYNWSTYKWCNGSYNTQTKYCTSSSDGTVDGKTVLDPDDDVAHVKWGGDWRMPTKAEQDELRTKCSWKWTTSGGVNGYIVTGPNGNSIFLPAAGCRIYSDLCEAGSVGDYWSSSLRSGYSYDAYLLGFDSYDVNRDFYRIYRCNGRSVRAVCP